MVKLIKSFDELKREFGAAESSGKHIIVKFFATWCGACQFMGPRYTAIESLFPSFVFLEVDIEESRDLTRKAKVTSLPTFQIFNRQDPTVIEVVGANEEELVSALRRVSA